MNWMTWKYYTLNWLARNEIIFFLYRNTTRSADRPDDWSGLIGSMCNFKYRVLHRRFYICDGGMKCFIILHHEINSQEFVLQLLTVKVVLVGFTIFIAINILVRFNWYIYIDNGTFDWHGKIDFCFYDESLTSRSIIFNMINFSDDVLCETRLMRFTRKPISYWLMDSNRNTMTYVQPLQHLKFGIENDYSNSQ